MEGTSLWCVCCLATLAAALSDFYGDYEDDPGGYGHLSLAARP